jgi:hypothetical protein
MTNCYLCHRPVCEQEPQVRQSVWVEQIAMVGAILQDGHYKILLEEFVHRSCLDLAERLLAAHLSSVETGRTASQEREEIGARKLAGGAA